MARETRWNRIITDPGKFEGEPVAVRHYWNMSLNGFQDELIYDGDLCHVVFNNVPETGQNLVLFETDQGFVCHVIVSDRELEEFRLSTY